MTLAASAARPRCAHCDLPVPAGMLDPQRADQFCCSACRTVAAAIRECGFERYYEIAAAEVPRGAPARVTDRRYEAFDDPAFAERYAREVDGIAQAEFALDGLHCAACVWLVERLPAIEPGLLEARVDLGRRRVLLRWDPRRVALSRLARRLDSLGYPARPYREDRRTAHRREEERRALVRVGVAGAIAGNVMLIAFSLWGGMLHGIEPAYERLFRWWGLALTLAALAWPGRVFFRGALSSLRAGMLHMDVPVALALAAGTVRGAVNTWRGGGEVYFESLTAVVFLLLVGRWVQLRRQGAAHEAVEGLFRLTPLTARRVGTAAPGSPATDVPVEALGAGELVEVRAGDSFPVDGAIVGGATSIDRSLLTGESVPIAARVGDAVHAGTVNVDAPVVVRVERTGDATRVGRLAALVERLAAERPPIVRLADRVAHRFVLVVLLAAAATAAAWWPRDPAAAIEHAIALLIVTCPCALGLATPLAVVAAIGRAARRGILVKGGETLERLARPGTVFLDKTGTLTVGRLEVVRRRDAPGNEASSRVTSRLVAAAEAGVVHPVADALRRALAEEGPRPIADGVVWEPGGGVSARVDGRRVSVGAPAWLERSATAMPDWVRDAVRDAARDGCTPVVAAIDGTPRVVFGLADTLQPDAVESVARLRARGWEVRVLSGDHPEVVRRVAADAGVDAAEGGASPEQKVEVVRAAARTGATVVMVGDGVNDAAAMSAADVGVAVHGGAEPSLAASDVFVRRPGLAPLVTLIDGSRRALGVIRRNVAISLGYNLLAGSLAAAGAIDPLVAAVLMPLSSLSVLVLSYRSRTFGDDEA